MLFPFHSVSIRTCICANKREFYKVVSRQLILCYKALVNPEVDKTFGTPPTVPYQHAVVKYESPTTILISGDLIIGYTGTFNSVLWEAMDLLKNQYGFKIQQVMTSGVGSVGNPTIVYILMTK
jgi:hypothetical protein